MTTLSRKPHAAVRELREYLETADLLRCQAKVIVHQFNTSQSRLNYRLSLAGTSWQALKDAERIRRLDKLMAEGRASRANLMGALGFTGESSLRKFFIRHKGMTLDTYHRQQRRAA